MSGPFRNVAESNDSAIDSRNALERIDKELRDAVEAPSGKGAGDENFPVGSFLLPRRLRPHVAAFYALARAADDVADNGLLRCDERIARLDRLERAVTGESTADPALAKAYAYRRSAVESGVSVGHMVDLIHAFKQDAHKQRYANWDELMEYCALSAAPVGRFLLDLHREDPANYRYSDPLCHALQVLNHLQDSRSDYLSLDRVYLPGDWMVEFGVDVAELGLRKSGSGLRRVIDLCLDGCENLLAASRPLAVALGNPRLSAEAELTRRLANRLLARLRNRDPLAGRIALTKLDFIWEGVQSLPRLLA